MVGARHPVRYDFREYIAHEAVSNVKHEFLDGQIYAMAGGTPEHSALIASITGQLTAQLRKTRCRVHMADLRIRTPTGLATYPDVSIVCGSWQRDPEDKNTIINPSVVIEVLSPSTENYDRNEKRLHYQSLPSLQAYMLVAHNSRQIDLWTRSPNEAWSMTGYAPDDIVPLEVVQAKLDINDMYNDATEPGEDT